MSNNKEKALKLHLENKGKISIASKVSVKTKEDLAVAYTPGVAYPCLEIKANPEKVYDYTAKGNLVAVITDGSAVLGLGNIGALAGLPVMEGKAILMKELAGVDSFPICLDTQDTEEIIRTCKIIAPVFGAINLEDISAPRCVEIERRLINELDIPVFHDDQHGTAIIVGAALINVERLTGKKLSDLKVVISGTGAAGSSIARHLKSLGVGKIYASDITGVIEKSKYNSYNFLIKELIDEGIYSEPSNGEKTLKEIIKGADVFVGVSAPNLLDKNDIAAMNDKPVVFAMANPTPEIMPDEAIAGGAYIVGTGRSDFPNQINNCLVFPGLFKGALEAGATKITETMKRSVSFALANVIKTEELSPLNIVPSFTDERVVKEVCEAVKKSAKECGVVRKAK